MDTSKQFLVPVREVMVSAARVLHAWFVCLFFIVFSVVVMVGFYLFIYLFIIFMMMIVIQLVT